MLGGALQALPDAIAMLKDIVVGGKHFWSIFPFAYCFHSSTSTPFETLKFIELSSNLIFLCLKRELCMSGAAESFISGENRVMIQYDFEMRGSGSIVTVQLIIKFL